MNEEFALCVSRIPPEYRETLRDWAIIKVETTAYADHPEELERCRMYGLEWGVQA
jgi:hypothetical protein